LRARCAPRGPTGAPISWPPAAELLRYTTRGERLLPPPDEWIYPWHLGGKLTLRLGAPLLAAMPLGIIRPHAASFRGIRIGGPGPLAVGSRNCPILTDVEVWFWLGCAEEQEIPEDFRERLDQSMESLLLRLECMTEMVLSVQDAVAETVMGANRVPDPSPLLFLLAHITKRVQPRLIRAFFADYMPFVAPESKVRVAGPTRRMVAAVGRAIANLDGGLYSVGCLLDIRCENRFTTLANAVGGADASVLGRFLLDPAGSSPSSPPHSMGRMRRTTPPSPSTPTRRRCSQGTWIPCGS
jgi:hypothetical protein